LVVKKELCGRRGERREGEVPVMKKKVEVSGERLWRVVKEVQLGRGSFGSA